MPFDETFAYTAGGPRVPASGNCYPKRWARVGRMSSAAGGSAVPPLSPEQEPHQEQLLTLEEGAMTVHRALYPRDNLTDVWSGMEQLAEQFAFHCRWGCGHFARPSEMQHHVCELRPVPCIIKVTWPFLRPNGLTASSQVSEGLLFAKERSLLARR